MKAVQGIILSALCVPGLVAPVFAQTMEQSLYREGYDAVRVPMIRPFRANSLPV